MSGSRRSRTTQSKACSLTGLDGLRARRDHRDVDVVVAQQFLDAELLGRVVLDHQQSLAPGSGIFLDTGQRRVQSLRRGGFCDEGERAAGQAVVPVLVQREHLHRNVAGCRILLQLVQDRPAQHVGQEHVQRDRGRMVFAAPAPAHPHRASPPEP